MSRELICCGEQLMGVSYLLYIRCNFLSWRHLQKYMFSLISHETVLLILFICLTFCFYVALLCHENNKITLTFLFYSILYFWLSSMKMKTMKTRYKWPFVFSMERHILIYEWNDHPALMQSNSINGNLIIDRKIFSLTYSKFAWLAVLETRLMTSLLIHVLRSRSNLDESCSHVDNPSVFINFPYNNEIFP